MSHRIKIFLRSGDSEQVVAAQVAEEVNEWLEWLEAHENASVQSITASHTSTALERSGDYLIREYTVQATIVYIARPAVPVPAALAPADPGAGFPRMARLDGSDDRSDAEIIADTIAGLRRQPTPRTTADIPF